MNSATTFESVPRESLAHLPTPIETVDAGWPFENLIVKRDDLTGMGLSGNKARKLEYLIADARAQGADTLVTWGGVQSNCARALAVAAVRCGFRCVLVLTCDEQPQDEGNLLIDRFFGADIRIVPGADPDEAQAAVKRVVVELREEGADPYVVPFGGSSLIGVLGYVRAAHELCGQLAATLQNVRTLLVPLASGGTYVGLLLGLKLMRLPIRPIGAVVLGSPESWAPRLMRMARETSQRFDLGIHVESEDVHLIDARGAGYGQPTADEVRFTIEFGRQTGLLLDPVYTGKALYAWREGLRDGYRGAVGKPDVEGDLLFIHTGGAFSLFGHRDQISRAISEMHPTHENKKHVRVRGAARSGQRRRRPAKRVPPTIEAETT